MRIDLFYVCCFHGPQHRVLCLTQTTSSSEGSPCPGPPAEEQSKLFSDPPPHSYSHGPAANELGSVQGAPDFPTVSGKWQQTMGINSATISYMMWQLHWNSNSIHKRVRYKLLPPRCPDGGGQRWHEPGVGVVFGLDSVVEPEREPRGLYCASEVMCSVSFPSGQPWRSHDPERAGRTRSEKSTQAVNGAELMMMTLVLLKTISNCL